MNAPTGNATVRVVTVDAALRAEARAGALDLDRVTVARLGPVPFTDLTGAGWLGRLTAQSGAPVALIPELCRWPYVLGGVEVPESSRAFELDAFAVATVYATVVWDARAPAWHQGSGQADSAKLLRALHDMALRAYRNHGEGERLVVFRED